MLLLPSLLLSQQCQGRSCPRPLPSAQPLETLVPPALLGTPGVPCACPAATASPQGRSGAPRARARPGCAPCSKNSPGGTEAHRWKYVCLGYGHLLASTSNLKWLCQVNNTQQPSKTCQCKFAIESQQLKTV